jgi:hypothetical protein
MRDSWKNSSDMMNFYARDSPYWGAIFDLRGAIA